MPPAAEPTDLNQPGPQERAGSLGGLRALAFLAGLALAWQFLPDRTVLPLADRLNAWLLGQGWDVPYAHFTVYFLYCLADTLIALSVVIIGARACRMSDEEIGWRWPVSGTSFVWAVVLVPPVLLAVYAVDLLPDVFFFHRFPALHWRLDSAWGQWANPTAYHRFFTRAMLTPIGEELVYRGLLQGALRARLGSRVAVLGTAALFASIHPYVGAAHLVGQFGSALLFGVLRERSGSVAPPILAHVIWNQWTSVVKFLPRY